MSEPESTETTPDSLARAAAAGPPLAWDDGDTSPGAANQEAGGQHDSPAALDEELVTEGSAAPDPLFSIYREPEEELRQERRD
jgi:hypothetical protein